MAALALASSATSVLTKRADAPSSAASAAPAASLMSARTTLPPLETIMRAHAAPRPDAAPVTKNTLPAICTSLLLCLEHRRRSRNQPRKIGQVRRHDERVIGLGQVGESGHVLFGDLEVDGIDAAGRHDSCGDLTNSRGVRFGDGKYCRGLALRGVDFRLFDALGLRNRRGACARGKVDLFL